LVVDARQCFRPLSMSICLLIDTTIQGVAVGMADLTKPAMPPWHAFAPDNQDSLTTLNRMFDEGLAAMAAERSMLAGVVISVGPGSFTGIKVGLAYCYAAVRASGSKAKVMGLSSLGILAERLAKTGDRPTRLFLPATQTQGFSARSVKGRKAELQSTAVGDFSGQEPALAPDDHVVFIKAWPALHQVLVSKGVKPEVLPLSDVCELTIYGMWEKAKSMWPNGFSSDLPQPLYLRKTAAEERLEN